MPRTGVYIHCGTDFSERALSPSLPPPYLSVCLSVCLSLSLSLSLCLSLGFAFLPVFSLCIDACAVRCGVFVGVYGYPCHDNERKRICPPDYGALRTTPNLDGAESMRTQRWDMAQSVPRGLCAACLADLQRRNWCVVVQFRLAPCALSRTPMCVRARVCAFGVHDCRCYGQCAVRDCRCQVHDREAPSQIRRRVSLRPGRTSSATPPPPPTPTHTLCA